ncbi:hypothetical protein ES702_07538 [subsurface metagenome]
MDKSKINSPRRILGLAYAMDDRFKNIIKKKAKRKKVDTAKILDYYADHVKELLNLLKKKDYKLSKKVKEKLEEGLIKVSIPSLEQKFGKLPLPGQLSIFDQIENRKLIQEAKNLNIKIIGWDLSKAEDQAVFAIQKIYSKYGYRGNINNNGNALIFTTSEYYESYGVKKYKCGNKERFSDAEKEQAYMALINLSRIQCIMTYNIRDPETKKFTRVEILSAIIPEIDFLYTNLDKKELDNGREKKKKLRHIKIIPSKVLLDQIDNYYALLPGNFYEEIKEKLPKVKNKHLPNFIFWLAKTIALKKRKKEVNITEISFEKLSRLLRMDNWIKAYQKNKIETRLKDCFKQAKVLGYLNWYRISSGKTVTRKATLSINIDKFKPVRKIKEIIDGSFEEEHVEEIKEIKDSGLVKKQKEKIRAILGISKR